MISEFDTEPVRGLPKRLPEGERLLWQGAPAWWSLAVDAFHVRKLAAYFVLLASWYFWSGLHGGGMSDAVAATVLPLTLGAAVIGSLCAVAWLMARTTLYTITSERVVFRVGVAFPMTVNIPFGLIQGASFRSLGGARGNVALELASEHRVSWLIMWPHVRPWRLRSPQPSMRTLANGEAAARVLAQALTAHAGLESAPLPARSPEPGMVRDVATPVAAAS